MLNNNEQKILDFIKKQIKESGYPPSVREICAAVGLKSTSSVHLYLSRLEEKGIITKKGLKTRAIKVVEEDNTSLYDDSNNDNIITIPLVGNVAAGSPILAEQNIEDYFKIPTSFVSKNAMTAGTYMLKVKGESMINVGINNGDYIIISKQNTANNGEIVVALIDNEATVKTFYKEKDHIRLQPENDTMDPIIVKDVQILGKVVGLFRKY